uniref:Uncharacterized protein n=1 Tax=Pristionchus pacificus TaxID=54126 RepID=A0A2A6BRY6_PRIPA|eukprot:PDM68638.1 hypothetical protein PRIPAC_46940 [Pristionchus pacificus]
MAGWTEVAADVLIGKIRQKGWMTRVLMTLGTTWRAANSWNDVDSRMSEESSELLERRGLAYERGEQRTLGTMWTRV